MRLPDALVYWLCWTFAVHAQQQVTIPPCGLTCVLQTVPAAGCALDNSTCQCGSRTLPPLTAACMLANCTMDDALQLSKFQANLCHLPIQDRSRLVTDVFIAVSAVTAFMAIARISSKFFKGNEVALEDWILVTALALAVPAIGFTIEMVNKGFGKHIYSLHPGDLSRILEAFYIAENVYVPVLAITKLSILAFYLRIFSHQQLFRLFVYLTIFLILISTTIISVLTIVQCRPIKYFWDRDVKGSCLDVNALAYANSAMSIIQDVVIVVLPISVVLKLNMSTKRKFGVGLMFALGGLGTIISAIRLRALLIFGNSIDPSWDYVFVVIWTALELGVALIASCLPALRSLLLRLIPSSFSFSSFLSSGAFSKSSDKNNGRRRGKWSSEHVGGGWKGKRGFVEISEIDLGMTNVTWHGEEISYPRQKPGVPPKIIERDGDGKFRSPF